MAESTTIIVYARTKVTIETDGIELAGTTNGVLKHTGYMYIPAYVNKFIYTDPILKATGFVKWDQISQKETVVQWVINKSDLLNKIRVYLSKGNEKKTLSIQVNKSNSTLGQIAKDVCKLKRMTINNETWNIIETWAPPEPYRVLSPDVEPRRRNTRYTNL